MNNYPLPVFILPTKYRKLLSIPQGTLYVPHSERVISGLKVDYAVGDIVSITLNYNVNIIDYKTRRREKVHPPIHEEYTYIINPPGSLSIHSRTILKTGRYKTYIVKGEEDLIPLAISLEEEGKLVGYGQPNVGVVLLKTSIYRARKLLKTFKPALYLFNKA